MKKVLAIVFLVGTFFALGWYFLIKDYEYKVTFKTNQAPGIVYSTLIGWNNWELRNKKVVSVISKKAFSEITQELTVSDSLINIKWLIERESDSITKVSAFLTDAEHSFMQKVKIPFIKTDFKKRSLETVKNIREGIKNHKKEYKVSSVEKAIFPETTCAYTTLSCKFNEKAKLMIGHTVDILDYIRNNNIKRTGDPLIQVTEWNFNEDLITFDFCFPISKMETYPESTLVKVKTIEAKEAIKTTFNGNYKISDRGWFTLLDYAERNSIKIETKPIEVFLNNPHSGGDELEWEAEVYLPIKK